MPLDSFQAWALEQLAGLIAFDSAWWGNATANPPEMHDMHLHNCDPSILAAYSPYLEKDDFRAALLAQPGVTVNLSDLTTRDRHVRTTIYREFKRRFKIEWSLGTVLTEPISSLYEFLSVWRHDPGSPFSESERQTKELLMPHLVETHRAVRLRHFLKTPASHKRMWAVTNALGALREASPSFIAHLRKLWPDWNGSYLPEPLASCVKNGRDFTAEAFNFDVTRYGQSRYIHCRPFGALDQLTAREREIASRYAKGETYSAIAVSLSLSPATVRNHISHCFRKLGVNNKAELVWRLKNRT